MAMRALRLTPDLVAHVRRAVPDTGPPPGMVLQTDADYADWVARTLAADPATDQPIRLFAFGSLIWKPEVDHVGETPALAPGWHRAFCLRQVRFRGTVDNPGLMLALDRGGACRGVMFTLTPGDKAAQLDRLFRREFTVKPINNIPRWIKLQTAGGPAAALAFVMNRASPAYAGALPLEEVAKVLSRACGHTGSGAEYLLNTVSHLKARGIHDRYLWQLQALVAARFEAQA